MKYDIKYIGKTTKWTIITIMIITYLVIIFHKALII